MSGSMSGNRETTSHRTAEIESGFWADVDEERWEFAGAVHHLSALVAWSEERYAVAVASLQEIAFTDDSDPSSLALDALHRLGFMQMGKPE